MNEKGQEKFFLEKVKALLEESTDKMDEATRKRLEEIRLKALAAAEKKRWRFLTFPRWITVGALATAATAILFIFLWFHSPTPDLLGKHMEDFEILTAKEPLDLYGDLDFYRWLDGEEKGT